MQRVTLFKKFMMPCGLCATPIVGQLWTQEEKPKPCSEEKHNMKLIKPSELPIYAIDDDIRKLSSCKEHTPSALEQEISKIRKSVQGVIVQYQSITHSISSTINTGFEHSRVLIDYIQDEENILPRMGAVGIGGLTGLILGLRGGKFKKLVYTTTGATAIAAICYPKETKEAVQLAKHYGNISYNFILGVKPGDTAEPLLQLPELPSFKVPTTFSEFSDLLIDTFSTAASAANVLIQKAYATITDKKEAS